MNDIVMEVLDDGVTQIEHLPEVVEVPELAPEEADSFVQVDEPAEQA